MAFNVRGSVELLDIRLLATSLVAFAVLLYLFFPGHMTTDTFTYMRLSKEMIVWDHLPLLQLLLWRVAHLFPSAPGAMLVFSLSMLTVGMHASAIAVFDGWRRHWFVALSMFATPVLGISGVLWGDLLVVHAACASLGLIALIWYRGVRAPVIFGLAFAFALIAALSRSNSIVLAPILFFLIFWTARTPKDLWGVVRNIVLSSVLTFFLYLAWGSAHAALAGDRKANFLGNLHGFDIAGASVAANQNLFSGPYKEILNSNISIDVIRNNYEDTYHACLFRERRKCPDVVLKYGAEQSEYDTLQKNWLAVIRHYPGAYAEHRMSFSKHLLGISDTALWANAVRMRITPNEEGIEYQARPLAEPIFDYFLSNEKLILLRPWPYVLFIFSLAIAAARNVIVRWSRGQDVDAPLFVLGVSGCGLAYLFPLFLAATSHDFRYVAPTISAAVVLFWAGVLHYLPNALLELRVRLTRIYTS